MVRSLSEIGQPTWVQIFEYATMPLIDQLRVASETMSSYYSGEVLAPLGGETMPG